MPEPGAVPRPRQQPPAAGSHLAHHRPRLAQLLMALKHPNIVSCKECFVHQSKLCIVMDYCSEGEAPSILGLLARRQRSLSWLPGCLAACCGWN
jgi:serine/threonine protein kinase